MEVMQPEPCKQRVGRQATVLRVVLAVHRRLRLWLLLRLVLLLPVVPAVLVPLRMPEDLLHKITHQELLLVIHLKCMQLVQ